MVSRVLRTVPLGRLRLAEADDAHSIMRLVTKSMAMNFRVTGHTDIVKLIETCVLSICQMDINETIVGFLAAKDYPLVPAVWPGAWEDFVWNKYKAVELNARNTLFLHMLCWDPPYAREVVDNMLKSIFMHDPHVHFIGMMKSLIEYQLLVPGQSRSEASFKRMQALEKGIPGDQLPALWVAERKEVSPRLRIRRAVEEDNDDIVPIIERQSPRLRELYGDFYVSELISRHPESERVLLVCEHKEVAVGVMCLNTQINYEALENRFELSPFAGLKHLDKLPWSYDKDADSSTSFFTGSNIDSQPSSSFDAGAVKDVKSRVTWVFDDEAFKNVKLTEEKARPMQTIVSSQLDILSLLEEEEDELEFDIVNIDTDLLRLPRLFANGEFGKREVSVELPLVAKEESIAEIKNFYKEKKKRQSVSNPCKAAEPIHYTGQPNAFLLELFAMHPDYDERYGFDMLEAAFELFPDRDYCVMCLPSRHTCFPLLEHFTLVTPFGCHMRFINDSLYITHVNCIRGDVKVRRGEAYDAPDLNNVLEHSPRKQDLLALFQNSLLSKTFLSFVFLSQNQPIGFVVLAPLEDGTPIRNEYDLEPEPRTPEGDAAIEIYGFLTYLGTLNQAHLQLLLKSNGVTPNHVPSVFVDGRKILSCIVSPTMEPHGRWYLRDLLRQTKYSTLFWICRLFTKGDASPNKNLMSLGSHMMPVRPRRYMPNMIGHKALDKIFRDVATPFALWTIERPLTSLPKVSVNSSIVLVGASRTGLSFLETLLLGPSAEYLTFTNVTLVSEHGLSAAEGLHAADTCVPRAARYTDRYLKSLPFYYYLDIMTAVMVKIDRKKKCICLKGGGLKFYDELVLTCGHQFQHPDYLKNELGLANEVEQGKPCNRTLMDDPKYKPDHVPSPPEMPENVMLINSLHEANVCLRKLLFMITDAKDDSNECLSEQNPVIVYGDHIEAYSCIAALLELGVAAKTIAFVEPYPSDDRSAMRVNCFNNETVDERVQLKLEKLGVQIYRQCHLESWSINDSRVEFLWLMTPLLLKNLPCFALFYFGLKAVNLHAFQAITECGLVYEGGLVVGAEFETNDPHVHAAGHCTRYSRRLLSRVHHQHYCSEDVGEALARRFLHKLDPFLMASHNVDALSSDISQPFSSSLLGMKGSHGSVSSAGRQSSNVPRGRWQPVMKFESPIVLSATLPGPLYYMTLRKPGPMVPMAVQLLKPHQGHRLITDKRGNYFRLQLNALHRVESLCCLSNKPFSHEALAQLYGKHEAFFNNLLMRYQRNLIDDLFEYFTQPWLAALYQEPFYNLLSDIDEQGGRTVYNVFKTKFTEFSELDASKKVQKGPGSDEASKGKDSQVAHKKARDIPSECGQNETLRRDATAFWDSVGGECIVLKNLSNYLKKHNVSNPHYVIPEVDVDHELKN